MKKLNSLLALAMGLTLCLAVNAQEKKQYPLISVGGGYSYQIVGDLVMGAIEAAPGTEPPVRSINTVRPMPKTHFKLEALLGVQVSRSFALEGQVGLSALSTGLYTDYTESETYSGTAYTGTDSIEMALNGISADVLLKYSVSSLFTKTGSYGLQLMAGAGLFYQLSTDAKSILYYNRVSRWPDYFFDEVPHASYSSFGLAKFSYGFYFKPGIEYELKFKSLSIALGGNAKIVPFGSMKDLGKAVITDGVNRRTVSYSPAWIYPEITFAVRYYTGI